MQEHDNAQIIFVQKKWTPLMIACQNGHVDVVNVLLQHGASVDLQNKVTLLLLKFLFISLHNYECIAVYIFCINLITVMAFLLNNQFIIELHLFSGWYYCADGGCMPWLLSSHRNVALCKS